MSEHARLCAKTMLELNARQNISCLNFVSIWSISIRCCWFRGFEVRGRCGQRMMVYAKQAVFLGDEQ